MKYIKTEKIDRPCLEKGYFNGGEHTFLECEPGKHQTISVKLPNGGFVTFAFLPTDSQEMECVDVHSTVGKRFQYQETDDEDDIHYVQHAIGFSRAGDTIDTRKAGRPTGLITLLLNQRHHEK